MFQQLLDQQWICMEKKRLQKSIKYLPEVVSYFSN